MRGPIVISAAALAAVAIGAIAGAQTPAERPYPSAEVKDAFVMARTVTAAGELASYFPQGSTVNFQAFAGVNTSGKVVTPDESRYFYISIPGQPTIKLQHTAPGTRWPWTATWTIPSTFPKGLVQFKVLLKTKDKKYGSFVQIPVATSQLNVS